jgi:DNA uptake protein ComE-like DNA-binding protein
VKFLIALIFLFSGDTLKVDLNLATIEDFLKLPIGYEDAERIADSLGMDIGRVLETFRVPEEKAESLYFYRETRGPYESVYEILHVPGITPGDLKRWKYILTLTPMKEGRDFSFYVERIRRRGASEESPRESAFDEWTGYLIEPILINRATVDELYRLYGVSLIDAVAVVKQARRIKFRNLRDLRRTPGLSYYGYRNMRNYVAFREPERKRDLSGWFHLSSYYGNILYTKGSDIGDRIEELTGGEDETLIDDLYSAGWDSTEVSSLLVRLEREREEVANLAPLPYFTAKSRISFRKLLRLGWLYYRNPYSPEEPLYKGYVGIDKWRFIERLIIGNYRLTLGQALFMDNTDEVRDRIYDRPQGLYGDLTTTRSFDFLGGAVQFNFGPFSPLIFYSKTKRDALLTRDGKPLFYYVSSFVPTPFKDKFRETVGGMSFRFDPPSPFPLGSQLAINYMKILYDEGLEPSWRDIDIPFDRDSLSGDPSFLWVGDREKEFYGLEARTVISPLSIEFEAAKERGGGSAYIIKGRIQEEIFYINFLFRHFDVNYTNPFMRPFQEDSRFEDTPIERPYRLLEPLASELQEFPMPKPETGFYFETRFQPLRQVLTPRTYIDIWRDNTDGLWNYRIQAEIEIRPLFPLRFRYREKWQRRNNLRGLAITRSFLRESNLRLYVLLSDWNFLEFEGRYAKVQLTSRESYPEDEINGGFISISYDHNFSEKLAMRFGGIVWRTGGLSQWAFEDTGIDFLYGNGNKFFLTILERLTPNLALKLKFRFKESLFPHTGLWGREIHDSEGRPLYDFIEEESLYSIEFALDYGF